MTVNIAGLINNLCSEL